MKKRKAVKKPRKIARIHASASRAQRPLSLVPEYFKPVKKPVTLRLDADVLAWFKKQGRGYQTRINQALREAMAKGRRS